MATEVTKAAPAVRSHQPSISHPASVQRRLPVWLIPLVLSLFLAAWALRGVGTNNIIDTDAARHAMNGVFLRDLGMSGNWAHPIEFGRYYYGRLPALSMPYHPPLFPAVEALFFLSFGVSVLTARVLVALLTAATVFLFCRLVQRTHNSLVIAIASVLAFYSWRFTQVVASDVMLEFPSLLLVVASMLCLLSFDRKLSWWRAIAFAILAGAAVWTKQHAVFLGAVPFAYAVLAKRWNILRSKALWLGSAIFAVEVVALSLLSSPFRNTGTNQVVPSNEIGETIIHHLWFYWEATVATLGLPSGLILLATIIAAVILVIRGSRELAPYLAWAGCAFGVLLLLGPYDPRYLFFVYLPLPVVVFDILGRAAQFVPKMRASYIPAAAGLFFLITVLRAPVHYLTGPAEAASAVVTRSPKRVVYCGSADGNFVFSVRALDAGLNTVVISGDKLPDELRTPAAFEQFTNRYGVSEVIIEQTSRPQACDAIRSSPPASLVLANLIPMSSSLARWHGGSLSIYRVNNPSPQPEGKFTLPIPRIGSSVDVKF